MKKIIYFTDITIETHYRGLTWNSPQVVKGVVASGTEEEIKKDPLILRRVAVQLHGKAKGHKFDLGKIRIISVDKKKTLGLGYAGMKKSK